MHFPLATSSASIAILKTVAEIARISVKDAESWRAMAPGRNAAHVIFGHLGLDFTDVISDF